MLSAGTKSTYPPRRSGPSRGALTALATRERRAAAARNANAFPPIAAIGWRVSAGGAPEGFTGALPSPGPLP